FSLLAHRQGCEEVKGMCCMNISDHSEPIHEQLAQLKQNMNAIKVSNNPLDD
ncbi:hypothetical protein N331_12265, partial [Merops nubicus]